jgi:beta-1,4-mannosyl-glycoprotein beta-1,4-N-acetylglucosaminyltransferase
MKIFDCFTFFNELELLELRLMTLYDTVDHFVLVEANKTHTGKPKDFIFDQNKDMFSDWMDKIIHIKLNNLPDYSPDNIWPAENYQRLAIEHGLTKAVNGDKIIVSDADEIANPVTVMKHLDTNNPVSLQQHLFYYHVNCLQNQKWTASVILTRGHYSTVQEERLTANRCKTPVVNGGWHYSFMGGVDRIKTKVENIAESHVIIDKIGDDQSIKDKINNQTDLWNRTEQSAQKRIVDIKQPGMAPECIDSFLDKYPDFYYGER